MSQSKRKTNEEIIAAYQATGSIWTAAKRIGMSGQSVWERLSSIGYQMGHRQWTDEEFEELKVLVNQCTLSEVASRLGRSYAAVASMASIHRLTTRYGNRQRSKKPMFLLSDAQVKSAIMRAWKLNICSRMR